MADTQDFQASTASHTGGFEDEESLSPLEQEVLDEYARLLGNLNDVCQPFPSSSSRDCVDLPWGSTFPAGMLIYLHR